MGDRREVGRTFASPGYVLSWLPGKCIRRIRRLNPPMQPSLRAADWLTHRKRTHSPAKQVARKTAKKEA